MVAKFDSAVVAGALVAAGLLGPFGAPASATAPGEDGLVTFVSAEQIWVARNDRGNLADHRPLTTSGEHRHPRWSQDGTRIVYGSGAGSVSTIRSNGSDRRTLVASGSAHPTWESPSRIAFVKPATGKGDVYSMPAAGGMQRRLTTDGAVTCGNSQPTFSFDGRYVAYVQQRKVAGSCVNPTTVVKVVNRSTGATKVISSVASTGATHEVLASRIDFTADGRHLLMSVDPGGWDGWYLCNLWATVDLAGAAPTFKENEMTSEGECPLPPGQDLVPTPSGGYWGSGYLVWDVDVQPIR